MPQLVEVLILTLKNKPMQPISSPISRNSFVPRIGITMGDPAGVGPELCVRVLNEHTLRGLCTPIIFGDLKVLADVASRLNLPLCTSTLSRFEWNARSHTITEATIVDLALVDAMKLEPGKINAECGRASLAYLNAAIQSAILNQVSAISTGPIHKESIHAAGSPHIGHTEILAEATKAPRHLMMLSSPQITCSLVTAHVGLDQVPSLLTTEKIVSAMELTVEAMQKMRGITPRLTVCGLNPHAGEGGLLGKGEEERIITPAIEIMRSRGYEVTGPLPPDTAFLPARRKVTDAYICMYHDQGLIPLKMLAFDDAINITLGLPIIRTSVDHGTAFDIAWQGIANPNSMIEAIRIAAKLCQQPQ